MHTTYHLTHVSEVSVTSPTGHLCPRHLALSIRNLYQTFVRVAIWIYAYMYCSAYSMWCTIFPSGYLHVSLIMYCISVWIYADVLYNVLNSHFNIEYMQMYCAMYSMYVWIYANVLCRILGIQHPALPLIYSKCHSCHYLTEDWSHAWP